MKNRLRSSDEHHHNSEHKQDRERFSSEPSWFLKQDDQQPFEELVSHYRLSRNIHERPTHRDSQKSPEHREYASARPRPHARFIDRRDERGDEAYVNHDTRHVHEGLSLKQTFAIAAVMAVVSGGTVGFLSSQYSTLKGTAYAMLNSSAAAPSVETQPMLQQEQQLQTVTATVIPKKPVATATLEVNDVTGETNSLIPLILNAEPALPTQDLIMKISGLPEGAYLTSGTRDADKVWALSMSELKNVKLMIPQAQQPQIDVAVAAFEKKSGELAAPVKTMTIALSDVVVQPVAAPPPQQILQPALPAAPQAGEPGAIPKPAHVNVALTAQQQMAAQHAATGDSLLKSGDLDGARKAYEQAWASGSPDGALGMAKSFDPVVLAALQITGTEPSGGQALQWYERAAIAGKTEALSAIVRLRMKPD